MAGSCCGSNELGKVFRVQLYEFSAEGLTCNDPCDPYLKIDFDGFKLFKTTTQQRTNNPEWSFKAGFAYEVSYLEKLKTRMLKIQCFSRTNSQHIGEVGVDLHTVACGPCHFKLTLRKKLDDTGEPLGVIKFCCTMKMVSSSFTIICQDLSLTMQGCKAPARMTMTAPIAEDQRPIPVPFSTDGSWEGPFCLTFETTLSDLLKTSQCEHLSFVVIDETGVRQGEALLEFRKAFSTRDDTPISFKIPVTYTCTVEGGASMDAEPVGAVGELEGVIMYKNIPVYGQMSGGVCIDGQVEGGFWLYEGLPYPHCMPQSPALWHEHFDVRGIEHFSALPEGQDAEEINFEDIEDEWFLEAIDKIDLPLPWEKRRERGTEDRPGRIYYVDPRSKRTTWKDPRFLPEHWDQRVDPASGKVYFQYHKTKQTTYVDPRSCPVGWDMRLSRDGQIYFACLSAMRTTFIDPRGLPEMIEPALDDKGRMYFKNHETKTTAWEDPRKDQQEVTLTKWRQAQSMRWWKEQVWREIEEMNRRAEMEEKERKLLEESDPNASPFFSNGPAM